MPSKVSPGPIDRDNCTSFCEAVPIHTNKIFDSCKDKDCIEDLRVYPTVTSQAAIDNAMSIRARNAELLYINLDVEEVAFHRGYYSVDVRFFYKITGEAYSLINNSTEITGLAVFDKRVILFGSEGKAKIFTSVSGACGGEIVNFEKARLPKAVVEAVDPVVLNMRLVDGCGCCQDNDVLDVPEFIANSFSAPLSGDLCNKIWLVSLGQFSIVKLERPSQLLIPTYDYYIPDKECEGGSEDDPCSMFSKIHFPVDEFFPPNTVHSPEGYREAIANLSR